jgi:hypothetical protein
MPLSTLRRLTGYADLARRAYQLRRADDEQIRQQARRHLVGRMGRLHGLPQKLGQMLSFSHAAESQPASDFASLQDQAEPLPLEAVQGVMEEAWQKPLSKVLSAIDPKAHAASLGQVHRAKTLDGRDVAVKVQYPGIRDSLHSDLKMLGWLSVPVGNLKRGFDMSGYQQVILADLERELDYRQEAREQQSFVEWSQMNRFLVVPRVIDELSTDEVLVTEWQEGERWEAIREIWTNAERRQLAEGLLDFFLQGLFCRGAMHADWHPGNLRFRRSPTGVQLLLYDFGCVYKPTDDERLGLLRLIRATCLHNEPPYPLFLKLGFQRDYLEPLADKLPALCQVLFEPFLHNAPYDVADWRLAERVSDILGNDRWNFRIAGAPGLLFLLRAWHGLAFYLQGLRTTARWRRALDPCLDAFASQLDRLPVEASKNNHRDFSSLSTHLKIRVRERGEIKVEVTSRATEIDNLSDLLDDSLRQKITDRGINLSHIVADIRSHGYLPGPVFDLLDGSKQIQVWLE